MTNAGKYASTMEHLGKTVKVTSLGLFSSARESQEIKSDAKNLLVRALTLGRWRLNRWRPLEIFGLFNVGIERHQL